MTRPGAIIIEGHVQGLSNTRSLGEAGIPVYVVDKANCIARHSRYCVKYFRCPDYISDSFAYFLVELAKKEQITGWVLLPSNDHAVVTISRNKEKLSRYYKVITPSFDIIENIFDKSRLLKVAERAGIPIPLTFYFATEEDSMPENISFPLITKGRFGLTFYKTFGKKALVAYNETQLRDQLRHIKTAYNINETFTQEIIPLDTTNKTVSFTAFCCAGDINTYWMGIKRREHPPFFGTATFAESVNIRECYEQSLPLLKALNYTGVCEIEYLYDRRTNVYKLIEVNARTWLWVGLAKSCGVDYARIIYDFMNGTEPFYPKSYNTKICWLNPFSDTFYSFVSILKGKLSVKNYFNSFMGNKVTDALFQKGDFNPGMSYLFNLFSFLRKR